MFAIQLPIISGHIDIGQILSSGILISIGWGVRRFFLMCQRELSDIKDNKIVLTETTEVVNIHSASLVKAGLLPDGTIKRLHMGRREDDPTYVVVGHAK